MAARPVRLLTQCQVQDTEHSTLDASVGLLEY